MNGSWEGQEENEKTHEFSERNSEYSKGLERLAEEKKKKKLLKTVSQDPWAVSEGDNMTRFLC